MNKSVSTVVPYKVVEKEQWDLVEKCIQLGLLGIDDDTSIEIDTYIDAEENKMLRFTLTKNGVVYDHV